MKYLVIGLGSMGKRRIRCLHALGEYDIVGVDPRSDRRSETETKYGIKTYKRLEDIESLASIDACLICTPPDKHLSFINWAIDHSIGTFVEASVLSEGLDKANEQATKDAVLICPSTTLIFHPAIKLIKNLCDQGYLGTISNLIVRSGQFLPFWHKYEHVRDYYVSNRATGGAREIVPFELTWITKIFGFPDDVFGVAAKTIDIEGAPDIDDTYVLILKYTQHLASLVVDVCSRDATRSVEIIGSKRHLKWFWEDNFLRVTQDDSIDPEIFEFDLGKSSHGYNPNIVESMYVEEVKTFRNAVLGLEEFPNSLSSDISVLDVLEKSEKKLMRE